MGTYQVALYDPELVVKREFYDELYGPFGNPSQWRTTVSRRPFDRSQIGNPDCCGATVRQAA